MRGIFTSCLMMAWLSAVPVLLKADSAPAASADKLVYEKPAGVSEKTRLKGRGARGGTVPIPRDFALVMLSPDHTGLTVQEQPSLFWYLSDPMKGASYKLIVTKDGEPDPLVEQEFNPEKDTGIRRLNLKDIPKGLARDTEYQVSVVLICNPKQRSDDIVTSATIKRVAASDKLISRLLTRPTPAERAIVYAKQGIWYDALAAISDQIAADPANKELHKLRANLLQQVGLPEAAAYDSKLAGG